MTCARSLVWAVTLVMGAAAADAQTTAPAGAAQEPGGMFRQRCAACHVEQGAPPPSTGGPVAAPLAELRTRQSAEAVFRIMSDGNLMAAQAKGWSTDDRRRVAEWVTGKPLPVADLLWPKEGRCTAAAPPINDPFSGGFWNGWGVDAGNGRFQPPGPAGIRGADVSKLKLKWAFAFPNATQAYAQPAVAAGRVFVGSENGAVYAIDARTGCTYWAFIAGAPVRTAIAIGRSKEAPSGTLLYFGDLQSRVYAIDARTGTQVWKQTIDDHPMGQVTGAPVLHDGRLYVPVSGVREESAVGNPNYECCTFRGNLVSLDAHTGTVYWKTYAILEAPKPRGKNARGTQLYGPAGASIWGAPTLDPQRGAVYVGTGNGFNRPVPDTTDAVLAFSMKDGTLLWKRQLTPDDAGGIELDVDIAASPILRRLPNGRRVLVVGQKSGDVYAFDPDRQGEQLWHVKLSKGALWGGIEWGMAADDRLVYVPISDYPMFNTKNPPTPEAGSLTALRLDTGERVWTQKGVVTCTGAISECHPAKSAAITATLDAVFAGSLDGFLRAHSTEDGRQLWEFQTAVEFTTVNGVRGRGGSINGPGPTIAGGMLYVNSGYSFFAKGGNVLLAFGPE